MNQARLFLMARKPEAHHIASLLDDGFEEDGVPTALFETEENTGIWCYSVYVEASDKERWKEIIRQRLGSDAFGLDLQEETLENIDWVSSTLHRLSPVSAGRFFIHGSHDRTQARHKRIPVEIDAGQAFGTGHHGTTAGCLDILELCLRCENSRQPIRRALDVGTGSGVLAISLAKSLNIPILATDIDPVAVKVARENSILNGVGSQIRAVTATGFQNPAFDAFGEADLVFANILARPLEGLAGPMRQYLARGAKVILSGLLPHQRPRITAAYRRQGLVLERWHIRDGWLTILMRLP